MTAPPTLREPPGAEGSAPLEAGKEAGELLAWLRGRGAGTERSRLWGERGSQGWGARAGQIRPSTERQKKGRQMLSRQEHMLTSVVVADFHGGGCKN